MKAPWYRLYAADLLTDSKFGEIPLEAQAVVLRMWCVCHIHGSVLNDIEEIARLTQCKSQCVSQCELHWRKFFELHKGRLFSPRMEREKSRSEANKKGAAARWGEKTSDERIANRIPTRIANRIPNRIASSDYDYDNKKVPPENSDELVERIAMLHPGLSHIKAHELSPLLINTIVDRCAAGDAEQMLEGTAAFAEMIRRTPENERKFKPGFLSPLKFWEEREYRKYLKKSPEQSEEPLTLLEKTKLQRYGVFEYDGKPAAEMRALLAERELEAKADRGLKLAN